MKTPLLLSGLALAASVLALALASLRPPPAGTLPAERPAGPGPDEALQARVQALAEENGALRERVALLELRPVPEAREDAGASEEPPLTRAEFEAFREELEARLVRAGMSARLAEDDPQAFQARVAESLEAIREDDRAEAIQRKLDDWARRVDETVLPALRKQLELAPGQEPLVREALLRQTDRDRELVRLWEEGDHTAAELGEIKQANRRAHLDELSRVLGPDQLERYAGLGKD